MARVLFTIFPFALSIISILNAQTNYTCSNSSECSVSCSIGTSNCPTYIDGRPSTYLNVNCTGNFCQNRNIKCPLGGCSINCYGNHTCRGMIIQYDGNISDYGNISINCEGEQCTCYNMSINAEHIYNIRLKCTSLSTSSSYGPCQYTLNANNANNVTISANERWASFRDIWNVENANYVTLNVRGYCMCTCF